MKKIINLIFNLLIIIIFLFILCFTLLSLRNEDRKVMSYGIYQVVSGSMYPVLEINDFVLIKEVEDYKVNDIITYKKNGEYITHRIINIDGNEIIAKGDANNKNDDVILKESIIGKFICKLNVLKFIYKIYTNYYFIGCLCIIIIILMFKNILKKGK